MIIYSVVLTSCFLKIGLMIPRSLSSSKICIDRRNALTIKLILEAQLLRASCWKYKEKRC